MDDAAIDDRAFDDVTQALDSAGPAEALHGIAARFSREQRFHELFDVRLMQARLAQGVPIGLATPLDDLDEPGRSRLEEAYLAACREIGRRLLAEGRLREAWAYLRPTGEKEDLAAAIRAVEPTDERLEELIGLGLAEGIVPAYGFQLVLNRYGTCNAISAFDGQLAQFGRREQIAGAELLVRRVHGELLESVCADIESREGGRPDAEAGLANLLEGREALFEGGNYHLDTTHLHSTVRIARVIEDPAAVRLGWELCAYGRRLDRQFQFAGEEPFTDHYLHHGLFFGAQIGERMEEGVGHFRDRAEQCAVDICGSGPLESYVALLARLGRWAEALAEHVRLAPAGAALSGFAPPLLELSRKAGDFGPAKELSRKRGDLLGFAAAALCERELERVEEEQRR